MDASRARYGVVVKGSPPTAGPPRVLLAQLGTAKVNEEDWPLWAVLVLHPGGRRGVVQEATFGPQNVWEEQQ